MESYGWDVIFTCSCRCVNESLKKSSGQVIKSLDYEDTVIKLSANIDNWTITPGGSGILLQFEISFSDGSLILKEDNQSFSLKGVTPLLQMQLKFSDANTNDTNIKNLVFNCTSLSNLPAGGDTTPGAVAVINPDISGIFESQFQDKQIAALVMSLLSNGIGEAVLKHASELTFVFSSTLPTSSQTYPWLKPANQTAIAYGYQQPIKGDLGYMSVFWNIDNEDISNIPLSVDPDLLENNNYDFGFILGKHAYMAHFALPLLEAIFATQSGVTISDNGTLRYTGDLPQVTVTPEYEDDNYTPFVTDMDIHIDNNALHCYIASRANVKDLLKEVGYAEANFTANHISYFEKGNANVSFDIDPGVSNSDSVDEGTGSGKGGEYFKETLYELKPALSKQLSDSCTMLHYIMNFEAQGISWNVQNDFQYTDGGVAGNLFCRGKIN